jgi:hypothetical protein
MLRSCVLAIGFAALLGAPGLGLAAPVCNDGIDNDGDGETDFPNDPGCASEVDNAETDSETECDDGIDNDGDGFIDFPSDPGCGSLVDNLEDPACDDWIDNDGDGLIDFPDDPSCDASSGASEVSPMACDDGVDSDGDGLIDLNDPGCEDGLSIHENPACDDDHDNDGDGLLDWDGAGVGAPDPECVGAPFAKSEDGSPPCVSADSDGDGVMDCEDNCIDRSEPSQYDADGDLCGNACDTDHDQSGISGFPDFGMFVAAFGTTDPIANTYPPYAPFGIVGYVEFGQFVSGFSSLPGPSGTTPGTVACP